MNPILVRIGSYELPSYVALMVLAGLVSILGFRLLLGRMGLKPAEHFWYLANCIGCAGFLGGRLMYLVLRPEAVGNSPGWLATLTSANEGLATYGVLAGILAGTGFACWRLQLSFRHVLDYVCLIVPVGHGIARMGCFLEGCCYGRTIHGTLPWAVVFTNPASAVPPSLLGVALHPTQLYEAAGNTLLAALLYFLILPRVEKGTMPSGSVAGAYFAGYGLLRLLVDCYRGDPDPHAVYGLTLAQIFSLAALLAAGAFLILAASRPRSLSPHPQPHP